MSKMSELSTAIAELRRCGEALIDISESLRELFSAGDAPSKKAPEQAHAEESTAPQAEPELTITLEEVRAVLAEKSVAGHRAEVQALIHECGADRLSAIDPSMYATLIRKAEVL
ncbi:MAG: DNA ligase [bacterium]